MDIGKKVWATAEGFIPGRSHGPIPEMESHETACILNTGDTDAEIEIFLYFKDRDPLGPYQLLVPARRVRHIRFNDLEKPARIPRNTEYASVIVSSQPVIVQHTRLDSRQAENALFSTVAFAH